MFMRVYLNTLTRFDPPFINLQTVHETVGQLADVLVELSQDGMIYGKDEHGNDVIIFIRSISHVVFPKQEG